MTTRAKAIYPPSVNERGYAGVEIHQHGMHTAEAHHGHFFSHLLQMILAMAVGMPLHCVLRVILAPWGYQALVTEYPVLDYGVMAVFMTVPMLVLMRHHGYTWRQGAEMSAAMLVLPVILIVLVQLGLTASPLLTSQSLPALAHVTMLVGMVLWMVYRRAEYA